MVYKDLIIMKKTTKIYEVQFKDKQTGAKEDITDWTLYFTVKLNMLDTDANAKISKDITVHEDAINGKTIIELSTSDTDLDAGIYYYDIKYKDDEDNVGILISGRITMVEPVTQRE